MLEKSLRLHALPGVDALLSHAKSKLNNGTSSAGQSDTDDVDNNNNNTNTRQQHQSSSIPQRQQSTASASSTTTTTGADGRTYTQDQVQIIQRIVKAKKSGRGAHYRVLDLDMGDKATENDIKKAYRKISLKVHPDKNSAPGADEAFKAVGLAYATLSDKQKRHIYDQYGDEDPDSNQGSGMSGFHRRRTGGQQEVSPEDIFNAFFGGGMPGGGGGFGGPGFHVYSSGFGPGGMHFNVNGNNNRRRQQQNQQQRQQQQQDQAAPNAGLFLQFLPILIILLTSFFRNGGQQESASSSSFTYNIASPGENKYFSLTVCISFEYLND
jgi:DnaJ homolog subfamily B member 12